MIFRQETRSLQAILLEIGKTNNISHFNLVDYTTPDWGTEDEEEPNPDYHPILEPITCEEFKRFSITPSIDANTTGISSLVQLQNGLQSHLMMADVDIRVGHDKRIRPYKELASYFLNFQGAGDKVYFAESGAGLHLYGNRVLPTNQWNLFIESMPNETCHSWVAYSKQHQFSVLRLNANTRKPKTPSPRFSIAEN